MKKLFLLSILFICPWLVQAASVVQVLPAEKTAEQKAQERLDAMHAQYQANARILLAGMRANGAPLEATAEQGNQSIQSESAEEIYKRLQAVQVQRITQADIDGEPQEAVGQERQKNGGAWIARIAFPLVLAVALGLANNWLARRAGCGLERWRFYRAPLREWLTGAAARTVLLLWGEHLVQRLPNSFGHDKQIKRSLVALYMMVFTGYAQELGEVVPLPGCPGWRTLPSPHVALAERFLGLNLSLQCAHSVFGAGLAMATGYLGWRALAS